MIANDKIRHMVTFLNQAGIELPKPVRAALDESERVMAEFEKQSLASQERSLPAAIAAACGAGRDILTDPDVLAGVVAAELTRDNISARVARAAGEALEVAVAKNAEAIRKAIEARFDHHAALITEAHTALGGTDLSDSSGLIRRGGNAAQHALDATTSMAALKNIIAAAKALAEATHAGGYQVGVDTLAEFTPEQWVDFADKQRGDAWAALSAGARLRLAKPGEQAAQRAEGAKVAERRAAEAKPKRSSYLPTMAGLIG